MNELENFINMADFISELSHALNSGLVAAIMVRVWTILSTGASGGIVAGLAIGSILHVPYVGAIFGFALAIGGIIFQFKTTSGKKKTVKKEEKVVCCEHHYAAPAEPEAPKAPKIRRESREDTLPPLPAAP